MLGYEVMNFTPLMRACSAYCLTGGVFTKRKSTNCKLVPAEFISYTIRYYFPPKFLNSLT